MRSFLYHLNKLLLLIFYRIEIVGEENIPKKDSALIVSNHLSYLDGNFIQAAINRPIRFLVFDFFFNVPVVGFILRHINAVPINAKSGPKEVKKSLEEIGHTLNNGGLSCIFPEGGISRHGNLMGFKKGISIVLANTNVSVLPIYIDGSWGSITSYRCVRQYVRQRKLSGLKSDLYNWFLGIVKGGLKDQFKSFFKRRKIKIYVGPLMPHTSSNQDIKDQILALSCKAIEDRAIRQKNIVRQIAKSTSIFNTLEDEPLGKFSQRKVFALSGVLACRIQPIVNQNDVIGICLPSCISSVVSNLAVLLLGKTSCNINFTSSSSSIAGAIEKTKLKHLITAKKFKQSNDNHFADISKIYLDLEFKKTFSQKEKFLFVMMYLFPQTVTRLFFKNGWNSNYDDSATIIFSSGSSATPKGIELSHKNILSNCLQADLTMAVGPSDKFLACLPHFHSFGFTVTFAAVLINNYHAFYSTNPLDGKEIAGIIESKRATIFITTPSFLGLIKRDLKKVDTSSLRYILTGAEKLKPDFAKKVSEDLSVSLLQGYGATETSPIVSFNVPDYKSISNCQIGQKLDSVGRAVIGLNVRIVDRNNRHKKLAYEEEGLVEISGPSVMKGYLEQADLTKEVINEDGWYNTGDLGYIDYDGFLFITGRLSRFSKVAGEMVSHEAVEAAVSSILETTQRVCIVIGIPDDKKGEKIAMVLKNSVSAEVLIAKLKDSDMPNLWIPKKDSIVEVDELPLLASGKVDIQSAKSYFKK